MRGRKEARHQRDVRGQRERRGSARVGEREATRRDRVNGWCETLADAVRAKRVDGDEHQVAGRRDAVGRRRRAPAPHGEMAQGHCCDDCRDEEDEPDAPGGGRHQPPEIMWMTCTSAPSGTCAVCSPCAGRRPVHRHRQHPEDVVALVEDVLDGHPLAVRQWVAIDTDHRSGSGIRGQGSGVRDQGRDQGRCLPRRSRKRASNAFVIRPISDVVCKASLSCSALM